MSRIQKWSKPNQPSAEKIAVRLTGLNRSELKRRLLSLKTRFTMDFSEQFLDSLSEERLRHILLAAELNACGKNR